MKAINIIWDTDTPEEAAALPTEIEIPAEHSRTEDAISDYITNLTGFCHKGFGVKETPQVKVILCDGVIHDVLKSVGLDVEVEFIVMDKDNDYLDRKHMEAYRDSLYANPQYQECDYQDYSSTHTANKED